MYIKWITDKATKEFYGSTFLEMKDPLAATAAVMMDKSKFLGRPMKIYYCPPKPGDIWPPLGGATSNSKSGNSVEPKFTREKSAKPENAKKLYAGNLAYTIDDDIMCNFFKECGEIVGLRWLVHKDSGEFRVSVV